MVNIAGVSTQTNKEGEITHVTFDMEKHKDTIEPLLQQLGMVEKTKFDKLREEGITIEESKARVIARVKTLWGK